MAHRRPTAFEARPAEGWRARRLAAHALLLELDAPSSAATSRRLAAARAALWAARPAGLDDAVVGTTSLLLAGRPGFVDLLAPALRTALAAAGDVGPERAGRRVVLPVRYGDRADRAELEAALGLPWDAIVAAHAGAAYTVAFLGFTPGFPYLHGLPPELALPRRARPRPVPAGAVAIADGRAGVYPSAGPGGWWLLGTTPVALFDPMRAEPTALLPGDDVRFAPTDAPDGPPPADGSTTTDAADPPPAPAALRVLEAWPGGATLQAEPRPGVGHLGMAAAGALDPRAHRLAARLAGAPASAAAIELLVPRAVLRAERDLTAAWMGGGASLRLDGRDVLPGAPFAWPAGTELRVGATRGPGAVAVLAVGGGLRPAAGAAGHPALQGGSASTDVRAGVGGFGRALRAGDALALAGAVRPPDLRWRGRLRLGGPVVLHVHPGPHGEDVALAALCAARYALGTRDRMGARLEGPPLPVARPDVASAGVPLGAVQAPADGRPIVLLADRGRTGGYALVAVVDARDLPALAQARPGDQVLFEPAAS